MLHMAKTPLLFLAAFFIALLSASLATEPTEPQELDIATTPGVSIEMPLLVLTPVVYVSENGWLNVKPGKVALSLTPCVYQYVKFYCMNARTGPPPILLGIDAYSKDGFKAGHGVFPDSFLNYWAEAYTSDHERYFSNTLIVRTVEPEPSDENRGGKPRNQRQ